MRKPPIRSTLMLGWGNEGRRDDGLGPAFARLFARRRLPGLTVESDYQLQVEDAYDAAGYARVIFVDADRAGPEPFSCRRLEPAPQSLGFSSHSVSPGGLLALTRELYGGEPEAWLLGIRGYEFDRFEESLSAPARRNLDAAADFVAAALEADHFEESSPVPPPATRSRQPVPTELEGAI